MNTLHWVYWVIPTTRTKSVNKSSLPELLLSNNLYITYILLTEVKQQKEGRSYFNGKFAKSSETIQTFMKIQSEISIHDVNGNIRYANKMVDEYTE